MVYYYKQINSTSNISGYHSEGIRSNIDSLHVIVNEWSNCGNSLAVISMETFCIIYL